MASKQKYKTGSVITGKDGCLYVVISQVKLGRRTHKCYGCSFYRGGIQIGTCDQIKREKAVKDFENHSLVCADIISRDAVFKRISTEEDGI